MNNKNINYDLNSIFQVCLFILYNNHLYKNSIYKKNEMFD